MSVSPYSLGEMAHIAKVCMRGESYGIDGRMLICNSLATIAKSNRSAFDKRYSERIPTFTAQDIYERAMKVPEPANLAALLQSAALLRYNSNGGAKVTEATCIVLEMLCISLGFALDTRRNPPRRRRRSALRRRRAHARR